MRNVRQATRGRISKRVPKNHIKESNGMTFRWIGTLARISAGIRIKLGGGARVREDPSGGNESTFLCD